MKKHLHTTRSHAVDNIDSMPRMLPQLMNAPPDLHRAIRLPEVLRLTGLSRSSWYAKLNRHDPAHDPRAPQPFKLGSSQRSSSVWWAWEIVAYLQAKSNLRFVK